MRQFCLSVWIKLANINFLRFMGVPTNVFALIVNTLRSCFACSLSVDNRHIKFMASLKFRPHACRSFFLVFFKRLLLLFIRRFLWRKSMLFLSCLISSEYGIGPWTSSRRLSHIRFFNFMAPAAAAFTDIVLSVSSKSSPMISIGLHPCHRPWRSVSYILKLLETPLQSNQY